MSRESEKQKTKKKSHFMDNNTQEVGGHKHPEAEKHSKSSPKSNNSGKL